MAATILLIDDSATTRSILKVYLTGLEVSYLEAPDAAKALALLDTSRVHLVIADVNMPGMDGLSLVRKIRGSDRPTALTLPIVVLTGDKSPDIEAQALAAGASAVVRKPVGSDEVRAAVLRFLPAADAPRPGAVVLPFKPAARGS